MKRVIMNPFCAIPINDKSHVRGQAIIYSQRLNADIGSKLTDLSKYDEIYIDHGANYSGKLNLFGGLDNIVYQSLQELIDVKNNGKKIISLEYKDRSYSSEYYDQIVKRLDQKSTYEGFRKNSFLVELCNLFAKMETYSSISDKSLEKLIYGDSHVLAFSKPDQAFHKQNGKTLYSFLQEGMPIFAGSRFKNVTICLGSIDIRHHVFRHDSNPVDFATRYVDNILKLQKEHGIEMSVCAPVPVEYEGRKIPKTGYFEGSAFYGSHEARKEYTISFINTLYSLLPVANVVAPPKHWYDMCPKKYADENMELTSSVHISPLKYNSVIGW